MFYEKELNLLKRSFEKCHIPVTVSENKMLSEEKLGIEKACIREKTLYKADNIFYQFIFLKLPDIQKEQYLIIGPYTIEEIPHEKILEAAEKLELTVQQAAELERIVDSTAILPEESQLFSILDVFCEVIWDGNNYSYVNIEKNNESVFSSLSLKKNPEESDPVMEMEVMEKRYAFENQLMDAVTRGQSHKVDIFMKSFSSKNMEQRISDTLRNTKNYLIIMNTLLRKAAEKGGVHPVYLNKISSGYAREIESSNNVTELQNLMKIMFKGYCKLVNKHSTSKYSKLIRDVIIYIDYDLTADLSLAAVAEINGVSASYLSMLFKQETGISYTDYVNRQRMDMAKHLLKTTGLQIQTIAQHCGFVDTQYFSKVFKKYTQKTPRQYRELVKSDSI